MLSFIGFGVRAVFLEELVVELRPVQAFGKNGDPLKLQRFGRDNDGGYVIEPTSMQAADAFFCYGVADDISFENACANKYNKPVLAFDGGVAAPKNIDSGVTFYRESIGAADTLYPGQESSGVVTEFSSHLKRVSDIEGKDVFIKMDIEGREYGAFEEIFPYINQVSSIVMELHWSKRFYVMPALILMKKLKKTHELVHMHANNICRPLNLSGSILGEGGMTRAVELTLVHKRFISKTEELSDLSFPKNFDQPNVLRKPALSYTLSPITIEDVRKADGDEALLTLNGIQKLTPLKERVEALKVSGSTQELEKAYALLSQLRKLHSIATDIARDGISPHFALFEKEKQVFIDMTKK